MGYLHVADVEWVGEGLEADGARLLMPRKDLAVGAIAMVADPMGAPFYVMAPIPPPGKPGAKSDVFMGGEAAKRALMMKINVATIEAAVHADA